MSQGNATGREIKCRDFFGEILARAVAGVICGGAGVKTKSIFLSF